MAWLSGWSYRKEISITGQSGAGTNYQAKLNIGDSAGGDFHLEGHCTNFPQDIEVTDNDGTTLLKFWIEDLTADPLKMWVKVADDLGSNQTIYVYYGKSGATTNSDIEATMILGDDFGSSLDYTSRWVSNAEASYSTSGGNLVALDQNTSYENCLNSQASFSSGYIIETRFKASGSTPCELYIHSEVAQETNTFKETLDIRLGDTFVTRIDGGTDTGGTGVDDTWYYGLFKNPASGDAGAYIYSDNRQTLYTSITGTPSSRTGYIFIHQRPNSTGYIDWIFVRKYIVTEPAFSSAGSEETPPTGVAPTAVFYGPLVGPLGGPI